MEVPAIMIDHGASMLKSVTIEEWRACVELTACYRIF
jgi:hypothetical protein